MSEHTKTPWKRMGHVIYMGSIGSCDAETGEPLWGGFSLQHCPNPEANARHIVHCVNNYDRLVEALQKAVETIEDQYDTIWGMAGYGQKPDCKEAQENRALLAQLDTKGEE